jgi:polyprenyl-phospho-N-acetylgalactosaminyl synthase
MTNKIKDVFVIIPVYNEERMIGTVVDSLKTKFTNIVCVDDGSSDKSLAIIKSKNVHTLKHLINLGQGASLQTGIDFAILNGARYFLTFDSDGQHNLKDSLQMIRLIKKTNFDVILGSRFLNNQHQKKIPFLRKLILKIAIKLSNFFSNINLTDTHNGLRVFNLKFAKKLEIKLNRMSHPSDILKNISKNKFKFKEYSSKIIYSDYSISKGQKNINSFNILFDMIFGIFR